MGEKRKQALQALALANEARAKGKTKKPPVDPSLVEQLSRTAERRTRSYLMRIAHELPVARRVERYRDVIEEKVDPRTGVAILKALERIESIEGIVTRKDQRDAEDKAPKISPMFILPAGVSINVNPVVKRVDADIKPASELSETKLITE